MSLRKEGNFGDLHRNRPPQIARFRPAEHSGRDINRIFAKLLDRFARGKAVSITIYTLGPETNTLIASTFDNNWYDGLSRLSQQEQFDDLTAIEESIINAQEVIVSQQPLSRSRNRRNPLTRTVPLQFPLAERINGHNSARLQTIDEVLREINAKDF